MNTKANQIHKIAKNTHERYYSFCITMTHQSSSPSSVLFPKLGEDCATSSSDFSWAFSFADDSFFWNLANNANVKSSLDGPEDTPVHLM
jgi:hypothetical protein